MKLIHLVLLLFAVSSCVSHTDGQWTQIALSDRGISEIAVGSSGLFAITSDSGSVFRSTDGGAHWLQIVPFLATHIAVAPNGTIFLVMADSIYRSTDEGSSWSNLHMREQLSGAYSKPICCVAVGPYGRVFCCYLTAFSGNAKDTVTVSAISNDNGTTWTRGNVGGLAYSFREHTVITHGRLWIGGREEPFFLFSVDDGLTWRVFDAYDGRWIPEAPIAWLSNGNILSTHRWHAGLFLSVDTCVSATNVSSISPIAILALPHDGVLVGTDTTGIYLFSDNGDSLKTLNEGLTDLHVHTFALDSNGYVYAGTNNGVWRRPVSQLVSVSQLPELPEAVRLEENYPNPFNPSATIKYELPKSSEVRLSVYDILGREVSVLLAVRRDAGVHEVRFDASNLASGVYVYRLTAGDVVQSKSLTVLK